MSESDRKIIIDAITRMLARREHSRAEILRKLAQKGFDGEQVLPVLEAFEQKQIQSDNRFAESRIRACLSKGQGPSRIRAELSQHGLSESDIDSAMAEVDPDFFELAKSVWQKKFKGDVATDSKTRQKQMQFLYYRGFSSSQIQYAIKGE